MAQYLVYNNIILITAVQWRGIDRRVHTVGRISVHFFSY